MMCKNIQPFVLKSGNSTNDQTNDIGPNSKLKSLYNVANSKWLVNYVTTKCSPHCMNSVLVESWDAFKVSVGNIIRDTFLKIMLLPLIPPDLKKMSINVLPPSNCRMDPRLKKSTIYDARNLRLYSYK